jgi:hypothetical protein
LVRKLVKGKDDTSEDVGKSAEGEKVEEEIGEAKTNAQGVEQQEETRGDEATAEVAAEVADSAEKLDGQAEA